MSTTRKLPDIQVAVISTSILGLINLASAVDYLVVYGASQYRAGIELVGFAFPVLLLIASYFDFRRKGWALVLSLVLSGLSLTNSTITVRQDMPLTVKTENYTSLIFSIVSAIACLLALARMMASEETNKPKK